MATPKKKTVKKATKAVVLKGDDLVTTQREVIDLKTLHGQILTFTLSEKSTKRYIGRISVDSDDNDVYVCTNINELSGMDADNHLGFYYSWNVMEDQSGFVDKDVFIDKLTNPCYNILFHNKCPKGFKIPDAPIIIEYSRDKVEFHKGYIQVGCTTVTNDEVRMITSKLID